MAAENARQFFDTLESRAAGSDKAAGLNAKYLFDVTGVGKWVVDVQDGKVAVREGEEDADTTITTSEETFVKLVNGEQNPLTALMTGKMKVGGDRGKARKLQQLF
jgi:putative sterol carrier protein